MSYLLTLARKARGFRAQMRLEDLSRFPVRLIHFALEGDRAECDWLMRPVQTEAESFPALIREQYASTQALCDAMTIRRMIFDLFPEIRIARIRAFRQSARESPSLVIAGAVTRQKPAIARVTSPAVRARLCGFDFGLDSGVLVALQTKDHKNFHPWQFNPRRPCEVEEAMCYGGK